MLGVLVMACALSSIALKPRPLFLQPMNSGLSRGLVRGLAPAPGAWFGVPVTPPTASKALELSAGSNFLLAVAVGAMVAGYRRSTGSTDSPNFAGAQALPQLARARPGSSSRLQSPIVVFNKLHSSKSGGIHPRGSQNAAYRKRLHRKNASAERRFLITPDGTVWHRQPGLTHYKHKRTRQENLNLQKLVKASKPVLKRVYTLMGHRPPKTTAADIILRKFNQAKLDRQHPYGMSDRGTGTRMFG